MQYIGIDMSKDTFHAAFTDQKVSVFANTRTGIREFIRALRIPAALKAEVRIGVESTGVYHLLLCRMLTEKGYQIFVINPLLTHRISKSVSLQSVKNDRQDAVAIRTALAMEKGYRFSETPESVVMRSLYQEYTALVSMKSRCKRQAEHQKKYTEAAVPDTQGTDDRYRRLCTLLEQECKDIQEKMKGVAPQTQKLLQTIPGIGSISSAALIAFIGNIERFSSPRKLVAYCGMACRVHESGTSIKGKGFLTKRGHSALRSVLFNAAFVARRHNPECKMFFEKKIKEGKHYLVALCATERKLIHQVYSVWKRGTPYVKRTAS